MLSNQYPYKQNRNAYAFLFLYVKAGSKGAGSVVCERNVCSRSEKNWIEFEERGADSTSLIREDEKTFLVLQVSLPLELLELVCS